MDKSTHKCEVVSVVLEKHPNADRLSIVRIWNYVVVTATSGWEGKNLGVYFPPDSVVDTSRPEFAFLAKDGRTQYRIRAQKLRGIQSFGLLLPAPEGSKIGDDLAEYYGVTHYEPPEPLSSGGEAEKPPLIANGVSKYDIDSMRRYNQVFQPGEMVIATEKTHGCNSSFLFSENRMWCKSHSEWKRKDDTNLWWKALANTPELESFCRANPDVTVLGEVYGSVQSFKYGCKPGQVKFMAFDVYKPDGYMDAQEARDLLAQYNVPQVPVLAIMPFDFEKICELAEGPSTVPGADHIREGCVVKPLKERWNQEVGRVILKVVGAGYLMKDQ